MKSNSFTLAFGLLGFLFLFIIMMSALTMGLSLVESSLPIDTPEKQAERMKRLEIIQECYRSGRPDCPPIPSQPIK